MQNLSAVVIVRNEETMLPGCLDSLVGTVAELVIVDTGSSDDTGAAIERESKRRRFESMQCTSRRFDDFAEARNRGLSLVTTPWTLWIDADERLSPELAAELSRRREDGSLAAVHAWRIPLHNHVLGRRMRCRELASQRHLRLFRTAGAVFHGRVHEGVTLPPDSSVGDLTGAIDHHTMRSWRLYWDKVRQYTSLEAETGSRLRACCHLPVAFPVTFWRQYVRRGCWRDGWEGLIWAATSGMGAVLRDLKRVGRRW